MKKFVLLSMSVGLVILLAGCMSLFEALSVDPPVDADASMIVIEAGQDDTYLVNNNFTGWAPIVKDAQA